MTCKWSNPDILIVNGDCIEGRQERQGGAELLTNDRNVQSDMAIMAIKEWDAKEIFMTYGTKYHVGDQAEDFEYNIAKELDATIEGRLLLKVEGMTIDARHKVGSSSIPHGRATSLLKDMMWNLMKSSLGDEPKADILIRSHTHYHLWIEQPGRVMFTTPCLQIARGRYGSRECIGEVHWGAIRLILSKGKIIQKDIDIWNLKENKLHTYKVK